jgi:bifunctional oligoribonuclease and PAP phosphatase NrnA
MTDLQKSIKTSFQKGKRILITAHIRPDGDAIGSSLALALGFSNLGKEVQVVSSDGLPSVYQKLPGFNLVAPQAKGEFDLVICLDSSEKKRTGSTLDGFGIPDVVIDHHLTFTDFGRLNLIDPQAAATSSILVKYMPSWGMPLTKDIATNLMTGLITDTIGFRTTSTTPEVLRQAATLLELGVDMTSVYFDNLLRRTMPEARYWGSGLMKLQQTDGIIWTTLSLSDRKAAGYEGNDDADLINILTSIDAMDMAIVFVEQEPGKIKVSWRGIATDIDVSKIASRFQGGGHKAAAGAEISGGLDEVQKKVVSASLAALQHSPHKR